ncbi:MAG TPA: ABC transporter permease [Candidatus Limnocylindria bacterium]
MTRTLHAVRVGIDRGITGFKHLLATPSELLSQFIWNGIPLAILFLNRDTVVEGTSISFATVALPGFLGLIVAASAYGPAYYLAADREDGTLLRAKAVPRGIVGYVTGVLTQASLETLFGMLILLIPGVILFGASADGLAGWLMFVVIVVLGLAASLPTGIVIGSVVKSPRVIGGLGLLVIGGMAAISGIFIPIQELPTWLGWIAQALPTYWIGQGFRFVFLPEAAAALEVGGTWRLPLMVVILSAWAIGGMLIAPVVLRRMARRASGASVEEARQQALQRMM